MEYIIIENQKSIEHYLNINYDLDNQLKLTIKK